MSLRPPISPRTYTLFPSATLFLSLVAALGAIDVEGDDDGAKESLRLLSLAVDARGVLAVEPVAKFAVGRSDLAPLALHLVEEANEAGPFRCIAGRLRDRTSVVKGKSVSVSVDLGVRRLMKHKKNK